MAKANKSKKLTVAEGNKTNVSQHKGVSIPFYVEGFWKKNYLLAIALFAITFLLYFQSIPYGYVLDDLIVIEENNFTKKGFSGIKDLMTTESMTGYFGEQKNLVQGNRYRPLSLVTFAMEYEYHQALQPDTSHFINILLYALTGILLFMVLHLLFPTAGRSIWLGIPFIASLIFLIHPIHVEAVANIKGRDEIMALLFSLVALYGGLRFMDNQQKKWSVFAGIMLFLGLMSKENAITFLAVIPFTVYFFSKNTMRGLGSLMVMLIGFTIAYLWIRFSFSGVPKLTEVSKDIMNNPFLGMTSAEKFSTIFYTFGKYIQLLFFPHPLTHDYYPYAIPKVNFSSIYAVGSMFLYGYMAYYMVKNFAKKTIPAYSILYYFITLSIVSNIVINLGTFMNDRFIFMASIGFCLFLAYILLEKLPSLHAKYGKITGWSLLLVFVLFYSYKTYSRIPDWQNALTLNQSAIKVSSNSARANSFMATALYNDYKAKEKSSIPDKLAILKEALPYAQKACEILPEYYNGNIMEAGIIGEIFRLEGDMPSFIKNIRGVMLRRPDLPYLKDYSEYVISQGYYQKELFNFYMEIGQQLMSHKKYSKYSIQYLLFAYKLSPEGKQINAILSEAYELHGDIQNAQKHLIKAKG
ncbi:MAG: hypothetical protein WAT79_01330 [Saprospiraceae bacterium]